MSTSQLSPREVIALCRQKEIRAIDLRFVDFRGHQRHFTIPAEQLVEERFEDGFAFDGSAMRGWQAIHESDMLVVPESQTAFVDPFLPQTLAMLGNIKDPVTRQSYPRDPRTIARQAEIYMQHTGLADTAAFGADAEFFVFDNVHFDQNEHKAITTLKVPRDSGVVADAAVMVMAARLVTRFVTAMATLQCLRATRCSSCGQTSCWLCRTAACPSGGSIGLLRLVGSVRLVW